MNAPTINTTTLTATTINSVNSIASGYVSTPTLNIPQSGNINLAYLAKINGTDTNVISLGTGFTNPTVHISSLTTVAPAVITSRGAFTPIGSGLSTILNIDMEDEVRHYGINRVFHIIYYSRPRTNYNQSWFNHPWRR